jgi:hypothetical protein
MDQNVPKRALSPAWKVPAGFEVEYLLVPNTEREYCGTFNATDFETVHIKPGHTTNAIMDTLTQLHLSGYVHTVSTGQFLINGGRTYRESCELRTRHDQDPHAHSMLEYASPEMVNPTQISWHFDAMGRVLNSLAQSHDARLLGSTTHFGSDFSIGFHENYGFLTSTGLDQDGMFSILSPHIATRVLLVGDGGYDHHPVVSQRGCVTKGRLNTFAVESVRRGMYKLNSTTKADRQRLEIICADTPSDVRQMQVLFGSTQLVIALHHQGLLPEPPHSEFRDDHVWRELQRYSNSPNALEVDQALTYQQELINASRTMLADKRIKITEPYFSGYSSTLSLWQEAVDQARMAQRGERVENPIAGYIYQRQEGKTREMPYPQMREQDMSVFLPPSDTRANVRGTIVAASAYVQKCAIERGMNVEDRPHIAATLSRGWERATFGVSQNHFTTDAGFSDMNVTETNFRDSKKVIAEFNDVLPEKFQLPQDLIKVLLSHAKKLLRPQRIVER